MVVSTGGEGNSRSLLYLKKVTWTFTISSKVTLYFHRSVGTKDCLVAQGHLWNHTALTAQSQAWHCLSCGTNTFTCSFMNQLWGLCLRLKYGAYLVYVVSANQVLSINNSVEQRFGFWYIVWSSVSIFALISPNVLVKPVWLCTTLQNAVGL